MIIKPKNTTAVLLAGGKSSRMGQDKGLLKYNNLSFCEHILQAVQPLSNQQIIVSSNPAYQQFGCPLIVDNYSNIGPLAGIEAAMQYSSTDNLLILSCDMPLLQSNALYFLMQSMHLNSSICIFKQERLQPFPGIYKKTNLAPLKEAIAAQKLSVLRFIQSQPFQTIDLPDEWQQQLININRLEDYNHLIHGNKS